MHWAGPVTAGIVAAMLAGCASTGGEHVAGEEEKQVLALQAFLDPESHGRMMEAWKVAVAADGVECAGAHGARPHMTFGSWKVTPGELEHALRRGAELDGRIPGRRLALTPVTRDASEGSRVRFHYVPEDDPALHDYHRAVHEQLGFDFEPFRPIDLPGQWKPHVTMFHAGPEGREAFDEAVGRLSGLREVEITSFGLVLFGPIRTAQEIRCAPPGDSLD